MWLHLAQTFLHVSIVAGCRGENAWVWTMDDNRLDDISYAGVGAETWPTLHSGLREQNVCFLLSGVLVVVGNKLA